MYSIGEISKLTGLSQRALRLYESKSLIKPIKEQHNNYRIYSENELEILLIIKFYKNLDFSLIEIKEILDIIGNQQSMNKFIKILNNQINKYQSEIIDNQDKERNIRELLDLLESSKSLSANNFINYKLLNKKERKNIMETLRFNYTNSSIIGKRKTNHDKTLAKETNKGNLYVIADGMGSVDSNASQLACDILNEEMDLSKVNKASFKDYFIELINSINSQIYLKQTNIDNEQRSGTTFSFMVVKDDEAFIGHVGDSRIYCFRNNELIQLTQDHTVVQKLLDKGDILKKDIYNHPEKSILYSCIGVGETVKEIFTAYFKINVGDIFLLMTDGIYNVLSESEIISQIKKIDDKQLLEKNIISLVEKHGTDNASILIVY